MGTLLRYLSAYKAWNYKKILYVINNFVIPFRLTDVPPKNISLTETNFDITTAHPGTVTEFDVTDSTTAAYYNDSFIINTTVPSYSETISINDLMTSPTIQYRDTSKGIESLTEMSVVTEFTKNINTITDDTLESRTDSDETTIVSVTGSTDFKNLTMYTELVSDTTNYPSTTESVFAKKSINQFPTQQIDDSVTEMTAALTETISNYPSTLDFDELVESSSTIHSESTVKPAIKNNEEKKITPPPNDSKNTKTPENQRKMGINYTETFTHNDNYTTKYLQQPDLANTIANITQSPKKTGTSESKTDILGAKDVKPTDNVYDESTKNNYFTELVTPENEILMSSTESLIFQLLNETESTTESSKSSMTTDTTASETFTDSISEVTRPEMQTDVSNTTLTDSSVQYETMSTAVVDMSNQDTFTEITTKDDSNPADNLDTTTSTNVDSASDRKITTMSESPFKVPSITDSTPNDKLSSTVITTPYVKIMSLTDSNIKDISLSIDDHNPDNLQLTTKPGEYLATTTDRVDNTDITRITEAPTVLQEAVATLNTETSSDYNLKTTTEVFNTGSFPGNPSTENTNTIDMITLSHSTEMRQPDSSRDFDITSTEMTSNTETTYSSHTTLVNNEVIHKEHFVTNTNFTGQHNDSKTEPLDSKTTENTMITTDSEVNNFSFPRYNESKPTVTSTIVDEKNKMKPPELFDKTLSTSKEMLSTESTLVTIDESSTISTSEFYRDLIDKKTTITELTSTDFNTTSNSQSMSTVSSDMFAQADNSSTVDSYDQTTFTTLTSNDINTVLTTATSPIFHEISTKPIFEQSSNIQTTNIDSADMEANQTDFNTLTTEIVAEIYTTTEKHTTIALKQTPTDPDIVIPAFFDQSSTKPASEFTTDVMNTRTTKINLFSVESNPTDYIELITEKTTEKFANTENMSTDSDAITSTNFDEISTKSVIEKQPDDGINTISNTPDYVTFELNTTEYNKLTTIKSTEELQTTEKYGTFALESMSTASIESKPMGYSTLTTEETTERFTTEKYTTVALETRTSASTGKTSQHLGSNFTNPPQSTNTIFVNTKSKSTGYSETTTDISQNNDHHTTSESLDKALLTESEFLLTESTAVTSDTFPEVSSMPTFEINSNQSDVTTTNINLISTETNSIDYSDTITKMPSTTEQYTTFQSLSDSDITSSNLDSTSVSTMSKNNFGTSIGLSEYSDSTGDTTTEIFTKTNKYSTVKSDDELILSISTESRTESTSVSLENLDKTSITSISQNNFDLRNTQTTSYNLVTAKYGPTEISQVTSTIQIPTDINNYSTIKLFDQTTLPGLEKIRTESNVGKTYTPASEYNPVIPNEETTTYEYKITTKVMNEVEDSSYYTTESNVVTPVGFDEKHTTAPAVEIHPGLENTYTTYANIGIGQTNSTDEMVDTVPDASKHAPSETGSVTEDELLMTEEELNLSTLRVTTTESITTKQPETEHNSEHQHSTTNTYTTELNQTDIVNFTVQNELNYNIINKNESITTESYSTQSDKIQSFTVNTSPDTTTSDVQTKCTVPDTLLNEVTSQQTNTDSTTFIDINGTTENSSKMYTSTNDSALVTNSYITGTSDIEISSTTPDYVFQDNYSIHLDTSTDNVFKSVETTTDFNNFFDRTAETEPTTNSITGSPHSTTPNVNLSSRRKDVDIPAWTDSTPLTDLTVTDTTISNIDISNNCETDSNCSTDKACLNGVCKNPCLMQSQCTKNTSCIVVDHVPMCICDPTAGNFCGRGMLLT